MLFLPRVSYISSYKIFSNFSVVALTCKLAISERPARRQTILAGGLASATQRRISASLSSSKSISGEPIRRMVGASASGQCGKGKKI